MRSGDVAGIKDSDQAFLQAVERFFNEYASQGEDQKNVVKKFGIGYSRGKMARVEKGERLRYRTTPGVKGFTVIVERTGAPLPPGDPCCDWDWDPDIPGLVCISMCD